MNRMTMLSVGLAAAAILPLDAEAITARAGLEACTEALVQQLEGPQGAQPAFRLASDSTIGPRVPGHGVWHLDVHDPDSGEVMAKALCRVGKRAEVRELVALPLNAADAKTRAR